MYLLTDTRILYYFYNNYVYKSHQTENLSKDETIKMQELILEVNEYNDAIIKAAEEINELCVNSFNKENE